MAEKQQEKYLTCKVGGCETSQQCHAHINETAENHVYHNLQILIRMELSAKQNHFSQNEKHVQQKCESTKRKWKSKAQDIGHTGNGRSAQTGFGDEGNTERIDEYV